MHMHDFFQTPRAIKGTKFFEFRDDEICFKCTMRCAVLLYIAFVVLFLHMGCASQAEKAEKRGRPSPPFPYLVGSEAYFYATESEMISLLALRYGLDSPEFVKYIDSLAVSFTTRGLIVFVRTKAGLNISTRPKRQRLMKRAKAVPLDEDELHWRIALAGKTYTVSIAYADALMLSDTDDLDVLKNAEFVSVLPKALHALKVHDDYALWFWASMDVFKGTFAEQKMRKGHGAVAIPVYNVNEDVSTDFAFPYNGVRSDFATLKLMLPFLFTSIGADILSSLPDISFPNDMVVIRGVNLPVRTVHSLADTITSREKNATP